MEPSQILELFEYGHWAFERVWQGIGRITDEQFRDDLGYSQGSIRNQVIHLISSHRRWLGRLQGTEPPPHLGFEGFPTRQAVRAEWDHAGNDFLRYLARLSRADLTQEVAYEIPGRGVSAVTPRWRILVHLVNHATDHRAQILTLLSQRFGVPTPEQDYILYVWERGGSVPEAH